MMTLRSRYRKMQYGGDPIPLTYKGSTYKVNPGLVREIASNAKGAGIDPYTALSIGYQESGLNNEAPYHLNPNFYNGQPVAGAAGGIQSITQQMQYAKSLQDRGKIPQGEDYTLQGYNGYGRIYRDHADLEGATKIYGQQIPAEGLNLRKNPLYGKRIIDIRDNVIKNNPEIQSQVNEALPLYKPHDTVVKKRKAFGGRLVKPFE